MTQTEEFKTESLTTRRLTAGKLTEVGETFILTGLETKVSQYGEFYVANGQDNGQAVEIVFSSRRLHKLLTSNMDKLLDKRINISAVGASFDRQYHIKLVD